MRTFEETYVSRLLKSLNIQQDVSGEACVRKLATIWATKAEIIPVDHPLHSKVLLAEANLVLSPSAARISNDFSTDYRMEITAQLAPELQFAAAEMRQSASDLRYESEFALPESVTVWRSGKATVFEAKAGHLDRAATKLRNRSSEVLLDPTLEDLGQGMNYVASFVETLPNGDSSRLQLVSSVLMAAHKRPEGAVGEEAFRAGKKIAEEMDEGSHSEALGIRLMSHSLKSLTTDDSTVSGLLYWSQSSKSLDVRQFARTEMRAMMQSDSWFGKKDPDSVAEVRKTLKKGLGNAPSPTGTFEL